MYVKLDVYLTVFQDTSEELVLVAAVVDVLLQRHPSLIFDFGGNLSSSAALD